MKLLVLDIETAPNTAYVWSMFKDFIPLDRLIATGRVMCFAYKWLGDKDVKFVSESREGHESTIRMAHSLLEEADVVLTYNGDKFDIPTLNREFLLYGLAPPAPTKSVDLYKTVKRTFKFTSNKLDHVAQMLGLGKKTKHKGFQLWVECMNGDEKAWKMMEKYNKQDVVLLEKLYKRMYPWIRGIPNYVAFSEEELPHPTCPRCGHGILIKRGSVCTTTSTYQRYQCKKCLGWSRATKALKPRASTVAVA